jgi:hypothetical protein
VRIAHLTPYQWSGFIYAAIYSCFLPVAYQVSFSGMVVVRDAHTATCTVSSGLTLLSFLGI